MATEIIFNNKIMDDNEATFSFVKKITLEKVAFSGSIEGGNTLFLFKNVKPEKLDYYIEEFNNLKTTNAEVKFVIQTHDAEAENL